MYVSLSQGGSTYNLALISPVVSETKMFENNGYLLVYTPGARADNPLGSFYFVKNINLLLIKSFAACLTHGMTL